MTRLQLIELLKKCDEDVVWNAGSELTEYAREQAHYCIEQAIETLKENYRED